MTNPTIPQRVLFPELVGKPVVATFDREQASSDGGAVLLKAAERVYDLVKGFARCLVDKRAPEKIRHTLGRPDRPAGLRHRVAAIRTGTMPTTSPRIPSTSCCWGRDPVTGERLASQPTLSRFENGVGRGALYRMARELAESVIERHRQRRQGRARRITTDLDPTDDPTHGAQQLTLLQRVLRHVVLSAAAGVRDVRPRSGAVPLCGGAAVRQGGSLRGSGGPVVAVAAAAALRVSAGAVPRARFLVRLDAGFATPEVFDFLDACPRLDYVISIPKNAVLVRHAEPAMTRARARSARSGRTEHVYGETRYAAGSWKQQRRVVIKAEIVRLAGREPRDNPRFVVTNLCRPPRSLYEKVHRARGDIENRIKELLDGLQIDRTSCCRFAANQLRVLLTAVAYVLMQELRLCAARTACARTQVTWLRDRLLKLGVHVVRSVRRVVLHLPRATPYLDAWRRIPLALGARTG